MEKEEEKISANQEQVHSIVFTRELRWQEIIHDLINSEQLDPWDVDIILLTDKYLKKIRELEEADFFISSQVLLAASFLLRIKSEMLLNKYIKSIDEILFGKEEGKKYVMERIILEEDVPMLIPRSPMPRFKRVSLQELIDSLNKAIVTENRRIKRVILDRNALRDSAMAIPERKTSVSDRVGIVLKKIVGFFFKNPKENTLKFSSISGEGREEKCSSFYSILHLEKNEKVWLEQKEPFGEIDIWMKEKYFKEKGDPYKKLKERLAREFEEDENEENRKNERKNMKKKEGKIKKENKKGEKINEEEDEDK